MAVVAATTERSANHGSASEYCVEVGILNNMPDAALERTERQFLTLLGAAADTLLVRVQFFSLATIERSEPGREHLKHHAYRRATEIPDWDLDALIVTGTEPREPDLRREAYWKDLAKVFDWVVHEGPSTLFSCLAAHAAVLHFDGIERRRLSEKRFGVFDHVVSRRDALTNGLSSPFRIAHSRRNELAEADLAACGYHTLTWSQDAGVDLFLKRGRNDWLFCQGHPEYDAQTLASEYRRDVRRWLAGETGAYPLPPKNYFSSAEIAALEQFRARAVFERTESLMAAFPPVARKRDAGNSPGAAIVRAWLYRIVENKRANQTVRAPAAVSGFATAAA